jgi:AraC-like DNA-binding protein/quercetin dioxygenase-like cupin family protein
MQDTPRKLQKVTAPKKREQKLTGQKLPDAKLTIRSVPEPQDFDLSRLPTPVPHLPILSGGLYHATKGQHYPAHYHPMLELIFYRTGQIEWHGQMQDKDVIVTTQPGMVLLTPPNVVHFERALTAYSHTYFLLDQEVFARFFRNHSFTEIRTFFDDRHHSLEQVMVALAREWHSTNLHRDRMIEHLFNQMVILFERLETEPEPVAAERLVRKVERILEERFAAPPTIPEIATELGVSSSLVRMHFAKLRGYSPKTYLQRVRLNHVLDLIKGSSLSLEDIADLTGYDSASHLSRHVKQATGKTPGAFRAK